MVFGGGLLEQREKSWTFGIGVNYAIDGKPFVPPADADEQLVAVASEIQTLDGKIERAEQDAAKYAGGLVLAMKLSAIATMSQTRAMLQQKQLSLKYALPQYLPFVKAAEANTDGRYRPLREPSKGSALVFSWAHTVSRPPKLSQAVIVFCFRKKAASLPY